MKKELFEIHAIDYLRDELNEKDKVVFEEYLKTNTDASVAFDEIKTSWNMLNSISVPKISEAMDTRFFDYLNTEVENTKKKNNWQGSLSNLFAPLIRPQLAYAILLLGAGLTIGYLLKSNSTQPIIENTVVSNQETEEVREKLVLTLLEQPSANKRLQGVSEATKIESVDETVMTALLQTLNNDSNVNVRLAAIESLTNYVDDPLVRQGLVQSIPYQESPIVQVTLANLMSALQEEKSIEPFRQLLKEKKLDTAVKKKIENTIESII